MAAEVTLGNVTALPDPLAVAAGYVNWNYNPQVPSFTGVALTSRTVFAMAVWLPPGKTVANTVALVTVAGTSTAPTGFFTGLAGPTGTMLAQSGNLNASSSLTATGFKPFALSGSYLTNPSDSPTGLYYVVMLQDGTFAGTNVTFGRATGTATAFGALGSGPILLGTGGTTGQTALPSNASGLAGGLVVTSALGYFVGCS